MIVVPLLVFLSWVEPGDEFVNEEPVEYAYEDQAFDNSENLRSIAMLRYLPLAISYLPYCHVKP